MTPSTGNAMCNAGGKVVKMVELEIRYGQELPGEPRRVLSIIGTETFEAASDTTKKALPKSDG